MKTCLLQYQKIISLTWHPNIFLLLDKFFLKIQQGQPILRSRNPLNLLFKLTQPFRHADLPKFEFKRPLDWSASFPILWIWSSNSSTSFVFGSEGLDDIRFALFMLPPPIWDGTWLELTEVGDKPNVGLCCGPGIVLSIWNISVTISL